MITCNTAVQSVPEKNVRLWERLPFDKRALFFDTRYPYYFKTMLRIFICLCFLVKSKNSFGVITSTEVKQIHIRHFCRIKILFLTDFIAFLAAKEFYSILKFKWVHFICLILTRIQHVKSYLHFQSWFLFILIKATTILTM